MGEYFVSDFSFLHDPIISPIVVDPMMANNSLALQCPFMLLIFFKIFFIFKEVLFIHSSSIYRGQRGLAMLKHRGSCHTCSCPHPSHYVHIKGMAWITSEPPATKTWGSKLGSLSSGSAGPGHNPWPHQASGNMGAPNWFDLVLLSTTLSALQKLRKLAWQGELSGASFAKQPCLLSLKGRET